MKPNVICPNCRQKYDPNFVEECPLCARTVEIPISQSDSNLENPTRVETVADQNICAENTVTWHDLDQAVEETPVQVDLARLTALLSPPKKADELGRLGDYRILRVLGVGGMGVIFLGEDSVLNRRAAVKAMLPSVATEPANRDRFLREARAAAGIAHENIVTIYQVGEDGDVLFMAMEFLEGESLSTRLHREERLPLSEVLRIGREIALGLAAAHDRQLIHRDIKPANLWIQAHSHRVKILDFGLARPAVDHAEITKSGVILGTPAYMAPEQARGKHIDARCDLYSLGTVLYRLTSGRLPFPGLDTVATLTAIATEEPPSVAEIVTDAPYELERLITRLMAKNPDDRPSTTGEVLESIAEIEARYVHAGSTSILAGSELNLDDVAFQSDDVADAPVIELIEEATEKLDDLDFVDDSETSAVALEKFNKLKGRRIAHYRLNRILGKGHFGCVFHATDESNQAPVALKLLSSEFPNNEREIEQFKQAMRNALAVQHPNLVTILGAGRTEPYCWIVMEYIEGESIAQYIQRLKTTGLIDWRFALSATIHVCRALYFVNTDGRRVHRNITASNLLLRKSDQNVLLNDLHLLKAIDRSLLFVNGLDAKTIAEMAFLAPEQASGEASFVDCLCDMYSLGVVVYMLLTGEPPFVAGTLEEALPKIRDETPVQPRKLQRLIPRDVEAIVMRMLEKKQENRFQDFSKLLVSLTAVAKVHGVSV